MSCIGWCRWDTACKLVIIANSILGAKVSLDQVKVSGIRHITGEQLEAAAADGDTYKLVARAVLSDEDGWQLSVEPEAVPRSSFIGSIQGWEMVSAVSERGVS